MVYFTEKNEEHKRNIYLVYILEHSEHPTRKYTRGRAATYTVLPGHKQVLFLQDIFVVHLIYSLVLQEQFKNI